MKNCFLKLVVLLILTMTSVLSLGSDIPIAKESSNHFAFFKKNKSKKINTMTHEKFDALIERVSKIYSPVISTKGGRFHFESLWENDEQIARASRVKDQWIITLSGGMARRESLSDDALLLIVCHELGHHLGGAPTITRGSLWASVEGQADYFATMKCMRRMLEDEDNQKIVSALEIDPDVSEKCQLVYKSADDIALCSRIAIAALVTANAISLGEPLAFSRPAQYKAGVTFNEHSPSAQCRLDTFYSGILCDKSYDQETDMINPLSGVCTSNEGQKLGARPLCWYFPGDALFH